MHTLLQRSEIQAGLMHGTRASWIRSLPAKSNHCRNTYRKSKLIRPGASHVGIAKAVRKTSISAGPEGNQNAKNLAKPRIRALEGCLSRQLWGVMVGKLNNARGSNRAAREHLSAGRNQESEPGAAHATAVFLGGACRQLLYLSYQQEVRLKDTKIDANCGYHISGEFLNTPETEGPGGERDGWVGWTDLFHGFVSVEVRPSLKCIRPLSVPRRPVEIGIQPWFGFERPPGTKLNIELASVGRFETWPHADSEASCIAGRGSVGLWAGFVLSLRGHANGWRSSSKPVQGRGPSQATAKLGPKTSSVANPYVFFLPEKERTNLKHGNIFTRVTAASGPSARARAKPENPFSTKLLAFSTSGFAQDRGYALSDGDGATLRVRYCQAKQ
ncbi:hypothetical protein B0H14DRAFT_2597153 [Mycena olivaceomarginata]|nr:hypothetical protein B0H14DRAFT_2597153 [Mycena olivaceomarginata]